MDKDEKVEPQQSSKAMDDDDDDDPYGFLVEQCIIPCAEENHLRSIPLFSPSPSPSPSPTQQQQQPSPPPVVKHEQTDDEIDMQQQQQQQPLEMDKEKEATEENMEVDHDDEESQSVTKEPTISPPPFENEGFSLQSPPTTTRDEPAAIDDGTPSPVTGEGLQKTIEVDHEESQSVTKEPTISVESSPPPFENEGFSLQSPPTTTRDEPAAAVDDETRSPVTGEELQKTVEEEESPLEQNEGLVVVPQSPPTKTQTGQTHFVPPRFQPAAPATAVGVGVGASSSSSTNPQNPKEEDDTTIDILDVLRSKGFYVPRPRWWRPEGYDKP